MTVTTGDRLLADYLARLDAVALRLPPDRRAELMEGIAEHVAEARAAGELRDEAAVRTLLDRLGEPEEIVAAASEEQPGGAWGPPPWGGQVPHLVPRRQGTGLETAAVLMLTVGSFVPLLGWLVGGVLLWTSRRWRVSEKLLGTLVAPGGPGLVLLYGWATPSGEICTTTVGGLSGPAEPTLPGQPPAPVPPGFTETTTCESAALLPAWVALLLVSVALVAPFVIAVVLLRRARARAEAEGAP